MYLKSKLMSSRGRSEMAVSYEKYARLRDERGMTDYQVCQETGIAQSSFPNWKAGRYTPKVEKLVKIARLFNVTVDDLLEIDYAVPKA